MHIFFPGFWFLSCSEEFNDICVSWNSRKTGLKTNFLILEIHFFSSNFQVNIWHSFTY